MKQLLRFFGFLLHFLFPYSFTVFIKRIFDLILTGWLSPNFKFLGKGTVIRRGVRVIGGKHICIGENSHISKGAIISAWSSFRGNQSFEPEILIGSNVNIGEYNHLSAINKISIGDNTRLGRFVSVLDNSHGNSSVKELNIPVIQRDLWSKGPVVIFDNVWIGDKSTILPGVTIGSNSIIGSNSVVTSDIPANSVAVGIPAKVVKKIL